MEGVMGAVKKVSEMTIEEVLANQEFFASLNRELVEVKKRPAKLFLTQRDVERLNDVWDAEAMRDAYKEVMQGVSQRPQRERMAIHHIGHTAFGMTMRKLMRDEEAIDKRGGRSNE